MERLYDYSTIEFVHESCIVLILSKKIGKPGVQLIEMINTNMTVILTKIFYTILIEILNYRGCP